MSHRRHGRRKPYTEIGIRRLPCFRCGQRARFQWNVCADGNLWRPVCAECDVALNELVLRWTGDPCWAMKLAAYCDRMGIPARRTAQESGGVCWLPHHGLLEERVTSLIAANRALRRALEGQIGQRHATITMATAEPGADPGYS